MSEFLDNLKVGDEVAYHAKYDFNDAILKVVRITNTMIVVGDKNHIGEIYERKFRKTDGRLVGGDMWSMSWIGEPSQIFKDSIQLLKVKNKAADYIKRIKIPDNIDDCRKLIESITPFVAKDASTA